MKRTNGLRRSVTAALLAVTALAIGAVFGVAGNGNAASKVVPSNQSPPTISGTPETGSTLTASNGTWNGTTPITYTYQWRRCDDTGGSCASISGATDQTYVLKGVDVGQHDARPRHGQEQQWLEQRHVGSDRGREGEAPARPRPRRTAVRRRAAAPSTSRTSARRRT